jgi:hypothetical protein
MPPWPHGTVRARPHCSHHARCTRGGVTIGGDLTDEEGDMGSAFDKTSRAEAHRNIISTVRQWRMAGSAAFDCGGSAWWPTVTWGGFLQVEE